MYVIRINRWLAVGPEPDPNQLEALCSEGFESVVDVRSEEEARAPGASPARERSARVRALGMEYAHVPVSLTDLDAWALDCFVKQLAWMPKPAYVCSPHGQRAALAGLVSAALDAGLGGSETLEQAAALGLPVEEVEDTVRRYVDARHEGGHLWRKS